MRKLVKLFRLPKFFANLHARCRGCGADVQYRGWRAQVRSNGAVCIDCPRCGTTIEVDDEWVESPPVPPGLRLALPIRGEERREDEAGEPIELAGQLRGTIHAHI